MMWLQSKANWPAYVKAKYGILSNHRDFLPYMFMIHLKIVMAIGLWIRHPGYP